MKKPRVLILHDRFQFRGGAERMVLDMARILEADIVTEFWTSTTFPKTDVPHGLTVLDEGEPSAMVFRYLRAHYNFWWKTRKLFQDYDVVLFSGNNCLTAALHPMKARRMFYCHTPVRYVYDLYEERRAGEPSWIKRMVYYSLGKWFIRGIYRAGLSRMERVFTNAKNVQERLWRFCHTSSEVLYPPIRTDLFSWQGQEDFYLSYARIDALKRIDVIVEAFRLLPEKNLVIVSGGEDEERIRALAKDCKNISFAGWVDDAELRRLVGTCIATIYIPKQEDFGMTPVESMSAGKPCIGVAEGGLRETILEGETGRLLVPNVSPDELAKAISSMTPEHALAMREACEHRAQIFSREVFAKELIRHIEKLYASSY